MEMYDSASDAQCVCDSLWILAIPQAFGESLARNSSLQHLSLDSNPLTGSDSDFDGIRHLAEALEHNTSLTSLNLHRCGLKDKGGQAISAALDNNTTVLFVAEI